MKRASLLTALLLLSNCVTPQSNGIKNPVVAPSAGAYNNIPPNPAPVQKAPTAPTSTPAYQKSTTPPKELSAQQLKGIIDRLPELLLDAQILSGFNVRDKTERAPRVIASTTNRVSCGLIAA